jgi:hypothetical protein
MLTTFAASAAVDISRIGAEPEVLPTGCHQGGLQGCRREPRAEGIHGKGGAAASIGSRVADIHAAFADRQPDGMERVSRGSSPGLACLSGSIVAGGAAARFGATPRRGLLMPRGSTHLRRSVMARREWA